MFDPTLLSLPWARSDVEAGRGDIRFSSMIFKKIEGASGFQEQNDTKPTFVKFIGQRTELDIVESLYSVELNQESQTASYPYTHSIRKRNKALSSPWVDDDFLVDDMDVPEFQFSTRFQQANRVSNSSDQPFQPAQRIEEWRSEHSWLISNEDELDLDQDGKTIQPQGFDDWISSAVDRLQDQMHSYAASSATLLEILGPPPALDAIDSNTRSFEHFLSTMASVLPATPRQYRLSRLPLPFSATSNLAVYTPVEQSDLSLATVYDSLVYDWLSPLSEQVPNRVRIMREKMIRSVVTEIIFSRISLVRVGTEELDTTNEDEAGALVNESQLQSFGSSQNIISSQTQKSSQGLDPLHEFPEPPYRFLKRYTTLNHQRAPTKRTITTISHWKVNTDPSYYDWQKAADAIKDEQSLSEEHPAAQRRRKREERKRRHLEKAEQQASMQPSTPRLMDGGRLWGSQPVTTPAVSSSGDPRLWSSQVKEESVLPMSQMEKGVFGSRQAGRKSLGKEKKKRRAAGF
ncbi:predicted protein [Uncinocarpus reesii 1704]|uniref:Uncharacterized protein n=1 Tax=Uncinocarpus reesii (strain UAMH 1704) TaxID=336963 RepID=C4JTC4_UNCRE|nr:uncharacterized protein UREG_05713 [Uncinocarpus reesii 1704]EEP80871.1 predicted protein [Uncinocarpus reesii 1704]